MIKGFTFERALSWPFAAPHFNTFPWFFGLAYAGVFSVVIAAIGFAAAGDFIAWAQGMEAIGNEEDPDLVFDQLFSSMVPLLPWYALSTLAFWVVWAMFETASQRRYVRGEGFSLGFGADEARMMVVGLLWTLFSVLIWAIPFGLIFGGMWAAIDAASQGLTEDEVGQRIVAPTFAAMGLMLLLMPLFVFLATRLAPCFALTVRAREIRFFDAWNVSRGRFWPILGAYLILSVAGSLLAQVVGGIVQLGMMPAFMAMVQDAETGGDVTAHMLSPAFLIPVGLYVFVLMFLQGVLQHVVGGPAAFAVRHDPRGGIEEENQLEAFI